ncbi:MAG: hypothetical protein D3M94_07545 [Rhodocyclales bacterium GT-UBC]|nr:MAG: hypothetical protein D3M94_07545 [Rhodocyclales bacterium GT-UBC]
MRHSRPSFTWPDAPRWRAFGKFTGLFHVFFFPIYFGCGYLAERAGRTFGLYAKWELHIPLVPWMIWPYLTLFSLFQLPLLHMQPRQIAALSRQSTASLLLAGLAFLAVPTHAGFAPVAIEGFHRPIFDLLGSVDTAHNLTPSLHVTFSALILLGCANLTSRRLAWFYRFWLLLLSISTVLVHQHHLLDVIGGLLLAQLMRRAFPLGA